MTDAQSRRMVLVTSCLGGGGAERIVATMATYWSKAGHEVHVVALRADEKGQATAFRLQFGFIAWIWLLSTTRCSIFGILAGFGDSDVCFAT